MSRFGSGGGLGRLDTLPPDVSHRDVPHFITHCRQHTRSDLAWIALIALCALLSALAGCSSGSSGDDLFVSRSNSSVAAPQTDSRSNNGRVIALIDGRPITLERMQPFLKEAAGVTTLNDIVLDMMLEEEARLNGIHLSSDEIAAERELFLDSLQDVGLVQPGQNPEDILLTVRRARGLGPVRFEALLRRTAMLRALVQPQVNVTDEMIVLAHAIEHGPKRTVRIITTANLPDAQLAMNEIRNGESFADVAARRSTDASAARGGLLEPFGEFDPSYPDALRRATFRLSIGEVSSPLAIDNGYAIVTFIEAVPADGVSIDEAREQLRRRVRRQEERRLMAARADRLRQRARVTVLDPELQFLEAAP